MPYRQTISEHNKRQHISNCVCLCMCLSVCLCICLSRPLSRIFVCRRSISGMFSTTGIGKFTTGWLLGLVCFVSPLGNNRKGLDALEIQSNKRNYKPIKIVIQLHCNAFFLFIHLSSWFVTSHPCSLLEAPMCAISWHTTKRTRFLE